VDNVKGPRVPLPVDDGAHTPQVVAAGDHHKVASVKLDEFLHLAGGDVDLHGVVDLDQGVGVADGAAVVGGDVRHVLGPGGNLAHAAQLVSGLLWLDPVDNKASLHVVEDAEVLIGSFNGNNIHEASGEGVVSSDLAINLDEALLDNLLHLLVRESIPQTVPKEQCHGEALTRLVGASAGLGGLWVRWEDV